ncbi:terpene cyclase/mutase family protein [Fictibacillus terranigra]|uniref:Prenyltransferase/squalene oxidase repeat-containing protein n=1 Tax=Fictibacillus terranigra TaxID=3058424 RepID=A0ABT8E5M6_9BACL|nr:prenyltransferase/squalene oxidase repeat-containing protein [Fictibacillus sp. CENA-BCM004]MDN4073215.1 prenyltransferase/squalene oxidase repeat-containing protein [Fictibacillus sp. CENA-BCM004]
MLDLGKIKMELERRSDELLSCQQADGSFRFCFENPVTTDAYLLVLLIIWKWRDEPLKRNLVNRILSKQGTDGTWRVYPDEKEGNLSVTIEAYVALCYSKSVNMEDPLMTKAREYISAEGGFKKANLLTRAFLSVNGIVPWPRTPFDPGILLDPPILSPIKFYDMSSYARTHFVPIIAAMRNDFYVSHPCNQYLSPLSGNRESGPFWPEFENDTVSRLFSGLEAASSSLPAKMERYMLDRIEKDGTLLSYASSTFFMVYGLLSLGYSKNSPALIKAIEGIISLLCSNGTHLFVQNSPSAIWDTSLILYSLLEAGVSPENRQIQQGIRFLLNHQQSKKGDWTVHCGHTAPGGWGFSESNTLHPDTDDTQAALRSISTYVRVSPTSLQSWNKGITWLLAMQNDDGGWPAFEKNTNKEWLGLIPVKNAADALIDPSNADITGRVLEFLGSYTDLTINDHPVKQAVNWLKSHQGPDGSWYGRWGVCYIYGTWAAVTGLATVRGSVIHDQSLETAGKWLESIQNKDGSWGESCLSDDAKTYIPLGYGTVVQTAWAIDALASIHSRPTKPIADGVNYLLSPNLMAPAFDYPAGSGLPGAFYVLYHSYTRIWPLTALSHVYRKYV